MSIRKSLTCTKFLTRLAMVMALSCTSLVSQAVDVDSFSTLKDEIGKQTNSITVTADINDFNEELAVSGNTNFDLSGRSLQPATAGNNNGFAIASSIEAEILNGTLSSFSTALTNNGQTEITGTKFSDNKEYSINNADQLSLSNVVIDAANADNQNAVNNTSGQITASGTTFGSSVSNSAKLSLSTNNKLSSVTNTDTGVVEVTGTGNTLDNTMSGGQLDINTNGALDVLTGGKIDASVNTNINADSVLTLSGGTAQLNSGDSWAGKVNLTGGQLDYDNLTSNGVLDADTGTLNVNSGTLTIGTDSSIAEDVTANIGSTLNITDGTVALNSGDSWTGDVNLSGGQLDYDGLTQNGALNATNGTLNVKSGTLNISAGSQIASDVTTDISSSSTVSISGTSVSNQGSVALNSSDSWAGTINLGANGKLDYNDLTSNGTLTAENGILNVNSGTLTVATGSYINKEVSTTIASGSILDINAGTTALNSGDVWAGTVKLTGGQLDYDNLTSNGVLDADTGTLNLNSGTMTIGTGSSIADAVTANIDSTLNITDGTVALNSGDSWTGTVNLSGGQLDYGLDSNGVLNATGGQLNVKSGNLTVDSDDTITQAASVNVQSGANLLVKKDMSVAGNISGQGTMTNEGGNITVTSDNSGLEKYVQKSGATTLNTTGGGSSLLFKDTELQGGNLTFNNGTGVASGSSITTSGSAIKSIIINNNTAADSILESLTAGGSGLSITLTDSNASKDLNIDGTSISALNINGNIDYSGALTGAGTVNKGNSGILNVSGDNSGFNGDFVQAGGTTNVTGNIFGGNKNINAGKFNVTADNLDYNNVNLGSNTQFTHTSTVVDAGTIGGQVNFTGTGATAEFKGSGATPNYTLSNAGASTSNTIAVSGSNITLSDNNYAGNYSFENSVVDLLTETPDGTSYTNDYTFNSLNGSGNTLNFDIDFVSNGVVSDTIAANSGNASFNIGTIKIHNDNKTDNGASASYTTQVLKGGNLSFANGNVNATGASTVYNYLVKASGKNITLERNGFTNENSLNILTSETSGDRFFTFSGSGEETYNIGESLGTALAGNLAISGNGKDKSTISGAIVDSDGNLTGDNGSLFDISSSDVHLTIQDVKITDASGTDGSVVNLNNATSTAEIKNSLITGNTATNNGGAVNIGTNGGQVTITNSEISGNIATGNGGAIYNSTAGNVNVSGTTFTDNAAAKGGAIYNDGEMKLSNVTFTEAQGANKNDIYNNGKLAISGQNTFATDITNDKEMTFDGKNTISGNITNTKDLTLGGTNTISGTVTNTAGTINLTGTNTLDGDISNTGTLNFSGTNTANGSIANTNGKLDFSGTTKITDVSGTGSASNTGTLTLSGDASGFTGTFEQTKGTTTLDKGSDFFGGTSTISGGTVNWYGNDIAENAVLSATGGKLVVGNGTDSLNLTIDGGSSIASAVQTVINQNAVLDIGADGSVKLNATGENSDTWNGKLTLSGGDLDVAGFTNENKNGTLVAQTGNLNISEGVLTVDSSSSIAGAVAATINDETSLNIEDGEVTLSDNNDVWDGNLNLTSGTLNIEGFAKNGTITANGGTLNLDSGRLAIGEGSSIAIPTVTNLVAGTGLDITEGGVASIDDTDSWKGEINLDGGTLNYGATHEQEGSLIASTGNLNILNGAVIQVKIPSIIADEVNVDIQRGSTVNVAEGGSFNLDSGDKWNGMITIKDGALKTTGLSNNTSGGGGLQQTGGTSEFTQNSHIVINTPESFIQGGKVLINENSSLTIGSQTQPINAAILSMSDNSLFSTMNNAIETSTIENLIANGTNGVNIDISPRKWQHDQYVVDLASSDIPEGGVVSIDKFNFVGYCPIDRHFDLQIFKVADIQNVEFKASDYSIFTPIGDYQLFSNGGGSYTARLTNYNPQVFRGQVSTLAMWNNQLAIDDMLLNHATLHSESLFAQGKDANKYAITQSQFAPYQYKQEDGGLWFKSFVNIETLSMSQGLNVGNVAYGTLIGADFPVVNLENGWKFLPTAYIAYNGSHQNFSHVGMTQNGGQGGFMGTFMKRDFIGSVLAYAGGYNNEMQVAGYNDNAGNWFAGTAAKVAYNLHATEHFIVQPSVFVSYNYFGKSRWNTDFGIMKMNSEMMNGVSVAPGLNLIYAQEGWSLYATFQYMYNINEQVGGHAGNVDLPNLDMRHGYFQYGLGVTKTWQDRLNSYFQLTFRNGGRTGIGFQLGLQYLFDWFKPVDNCMNNNCKQSKFNFKHKFGKTVIKSMK